MTFERLLFMIPSIILSEERKKERKKEMVERPITEYHQR